MLAITTRETILVQPWALGLARAVYWNVTGPQKKEVPREVQRKAQGASSFKS